MSVIDAKELRYTYKNEEEVLQVALDGVSIEVQKGAFAAILGHNGSGKSTFAKHINVLLHPQEGELTVLGMDAADTRNTWDIRSRAGMVFQNPDNQIVSTIVEEDVAFGPENLGLPREEIIERIDASLAALEMQDFKKRAPHMLSGGQKQRIAIAGILAMQPEIIVFDEPTAMLDPQGRAEVMQAIRYLNREQKKTVLLITHYMEEAVECDRVYVMADGRVIDEGTPEDVFASTDTLRRAGLMPPPATQVANALARRGIVMEHMPITLDGLVEELCRLKFGS